RRSDLSAAYAGRLAARFGRGRRTRPPVRCPAAPGASAAVCEFIEQERRDRRAARGQGAMDSLERTLAEIRSKAAELRNSFGDEERARAIEWAASLVERALQEHAEERLTLAEASARSGYSQDHLARLIREGRLPNAGRPH